MSQAHHWLQDLIRGQEWGGWGGWACRKHAPTPQGTVRGNPTDGKDTALGLVGMKYFVFCDRGPRERCVMGGLMRLQIASEDDPAAGLG